MAFRLSSGARTGLAGTRGLKDMFNGGYIDIYSGGQPASADYAETGVKLVRITLSSGLVATAGLTFGTAGTGSLPKSADVWSGIVEVAGVAGYFRLYGTGGTSGSSATERRIDGNVGVSGADMTMSPTTLTLARTHTVDEFTLTVPVS
jgi:hypothetical protein